MDCEKETVSISEPEKPSVPQEPHKMPTLWVIILCAVGVVLLFVFTVVGILRLRSGIVQAPVSKEFAVNGLGVTLNDRFSVYSGQENAAISDEYAFTAIREDFSILTLGSEKMTSREYLESVRQLNHVRASEIQKAGNGVEYFTFTDTVEGKNYHYFVFTVKGEHSFYIGQFFCEEECNPDIRDADFAAWAKTAREVPMEPSSAT